MKIMLTALPLTLLLLGSSAIADDGETLKQFDGIWLPTSVTYDGNVVPEEPLSKIKLEMNAGQYTATLGETLDRGSFRIDAEETPYHMDITGTDGPNRNKTILAIYELTDDKLTVCYGPSDGQRPLGFSAGKGSKNLLVEFKRQAVDE